MTFLDWVDYAARLASSVFVVAGLAGLLIKPVRGFCGLVVVLASYVLGLDMWFYSVLIVHRLWGTLAVVLGLFVAGVGVGPMAIAAMLFHKEWSDCGWLLVGFSMVYICRVSGLSLSKHA